MFRAAILAGFLILGAGFPALAQTTSTPIPPQPGQRSYPLRRTKVVIHILGRISPADRALLRGQWLLSVRQSVLVNWHPLVPDTTRPPMQQPGATLLVVRVGPHGRIRGERVVRSSGTPSLDRAAMGAVRAASPLPPFPPGVQSRKLRLRMLFEYN